MVIIVALNKEDQKNNNTCLHSKETVSIQSNKIFEVSLLFDTLQTLDDLLHTMNNTDNEDLKASTMHDILQKVIYMHSGIELFKSAMDRISTTEFNGSQKLLFKHVIHDQNFKILSSNDITVCPLRVIALLSTISVAINSYFNTISSVVDLVSTIQENIINKIDSLGGYVIAMEAYNKSTENKHDLASFLSKFIDDITELDYIKSFEINENTPLKEINDFYAFSFIVGSLISYFSTQKESNLRAKDIYYIQYINAIANISILQQYSQYKQIEFT